MGERMRGKFFVIEGPDATGKATQTDEALKRMLECNYRAKKFSFPRYEDSMAGALAGRMQMGEFGDPANISPYLSCLPYICDQVNGSREIREWIESGGVAISDRYFTSNVHQIGKQPEGENRDRLRDWLWKFGYEEMGLLKPDLVIVLLADIPICRVNAEKKAARAYVGGQRTDLVERDVNYQLEAVKEYERTVLEDKTWIKINCSPLHQMMSIPQISDIVWLELKSRGLWTYDKIE